MKSISQLAKEMSERGYRERERVVFDTILHIGDVFESPLTIASLHQAISHASNRNRRSDSLITNKDSATALLIAMGIEDEPEKGVIVQGHQLVITELSVGFILVNQSELLDRLEL